jgi:hypothetical protein
MHIHPANLLVLLALICLAAPAAAESNYIQIFTHPGSGTVCVDSMCQVNVGTLAGYSSTRFEGVAGGQDHVIRVYNTEGYEDYSETVYMDYHGDSFTSRIFLEPISSDTPAPGTGDIQVFVSPGLGQVCRDNAECESSVGEAVDTWSVRFSDVPSDTPHTITVTADGYQPYSSPVNVPPGGISDLDITLQPLATVTPGTSPQVSQESAQPPATRAALPGSMAVFAAGIGTVFFLYRRTDR